MYKTDEGFLSKALPDEKIFVLLARDEHAPATILRWVELSLHDQPEAKLKEATNWAHEMVKSRDKVLRKLSLINEMRMLQGKLDEITDEPYTHNYEEGMEMEVDDFGQKSQPTKKVAPGPKKAPRHLDEENYSMREILSAIDGYRARMNYSEWPKLSQEEKVKFLRNQI